MSFAMGAVESGVTAMFRPLLLLAALLALGGPVAAQANRSAAPATKSNPATSKPQVAPTLLGNPMVFYLAKGEADACGPGCSEWIAAEGDIDTGAPHRLRALLTRLGKRNLPIFLSSPGGLGMQAIAIGRLLREREMTAGVSKTIPAGCVGASDAACRALKRSGQVLPAELRTIASCSSSCVYVLIGAKVRLVPPGARLGVHSGKLVQLYPDGRVNVPSDSVRSSSAKAHLSESNAQIRRYLQEMRIAPGLFDVISRVPYEQVHILSRDEIAEFGIDARDFQETRWMAVELPPQPLSVMKLLLEAKGGSRKELRLSIIQLACAAQRRVRITYIRGLGSDEIGATKAVKLVAVKFAAEDRNVLLAGTGSVSRIDAIDTGGSFDRLFTIRPFEFFEAAAGHDKIDIIESDSTASGAQSRTTKLSTEGLPQALTALRRQCDSAATN
jgi:hypothetical protein